MDFGQLAHIHNKSSSSPYYKLIKTVPLIIYFTTNVLIQVQLCSTQENLPNISHIDKRLELKSKF